MDGIQSDRHALYQIGSDCMPRIPQHTTDCVVFLYRTKDEALKRSDPQGTGSIICCPSQVTPDSRCAHFYVVTNKHVAVSPKGSSDPAPVVCLNLKDGRTDPIELDSMLDWHFEPNGDDIAPSRQSLASVRPCRFSCGLR